MWKIQRGMMFFRPFGMAVTAWNSYVKAETISNCFLHCKICLVALRTPELTAQKLVDNEVIEDLQLKSVSCGFRIQWISESLLNNLLRRRSPKHQMKMIPLLNTFDLIKWRNRKVIQKSFLVSCHLMHSMPRRRLNTFGCSSQT